MDKRELRKRDFLTSIALLVFSLWMIGHTLGNIPMQDSWGGVMNVWYVSPGLFPLFIGVFLIILASVLGVNAVREGGAGKFLEDLSRRRKDPSDRTLRLLGILLVTCAYVYLNIPRIDFFLSTLLCLAVFISLFYFEKAGVMKKLFSFYLAGTLLVAALFLLGVDAALAPHVPYAMDALVFLFLLAYLRYSWVLIRGEAAVERRYRVALILAVVPSAVLIPVFKFLLLVPLPVEGAFVELMNVIRYSLR